jgi:endonuclease/exonuclease/phosphatase family metal-dependent hydrolase
MTWNIWHGGKEVGAEVGPKRVAEIIRESGADIIALQETYGSGEWLAK